MDTSLLRCAEKHQNRQTDRDSVGSEFQTIGPATEKARWPNVIRRQRGTVS